MTINNLPSIEGLDFEALKELRGQIDARLDSIRAEFINQAAAMGLACSADGTKKRRGRKPKDQDAD